MASRIYGNFALKGYDGSTKINLENGGDTIKVVSVTSAYVPNFDSDEFLDDVTNEVVGAGYTTGGATIANQSIIIDSANDRVVFDADDTSWATSSITARAAVIYKDSGMSSTSPLVAYIDFSTDRISDGGTFLITWDSAGIILFTY